MFRVEIIIVLNRNLDIRLVNIEATPCDKVAVRREEPGIKFAVCASPPSPQHLVHGQCEESPVEVLVDINQEESCDTPVWLAYYRARLLAKANDHTVAHEDCPHSIFVSIVQIRLVLDVFNQVAVGQDHQTALVSLYSP